MTKQTQTKWLLLAGMLAALLGAVADHLLLYHPGAIYERFDYAFLADIPRGRLAAGYYLGVLVIPFELLGLWGLLQPLRARQPVWANIAFFCTILVLVWGVAYHAALVWLAALLRGGADVDDFTYLADPLAALLVAFFLLLSMLFAGLTLRKKSPYPKIINLGNPMFSYLLFILLYSIAPVIGRHIIVAGFNLSIFFLLLTAFLTHSNTRL